MMERYASMHRKTNETEVTLELCLDGGERSVSTGVGFFDHMLTAFAVHGGFGLKVKTVGDWEVDCHHTVEEIRDLAGADSLGYLSLEGLHQLAPDARCGFCEGCFTEQYPIPVE